jgi:PhzF family phenazine biosynthesis protein
MFVPRQATQIDMQAADSVEHGGSNCVGMASAVAIRRWEHRMLTKHPFVLVDVFTDVPLAGNPLVLFPDADDLGDERMQAMAREVSLSETTFVVAASDARAHRRLRSFSPTAEIFGAGHNALGAWWVLVARGYVPRPERGDLFWQELGDGVLPIEASFDDDGLTSIWMTQKTPRLAAAEPDRRELARALSLDADALRVPELAPRVAEAGATRHLLVPVRGLADLKRASVDSEKLAALAKPFGCEGCYLFTLETTDARSAAHARAFFPAIGIPEDPATGTAAGPLGYYLVARGRAPSGEQPLIIEQGDEMGRPGRIHVRVRGDRVDVGGRCTIVGEGVLFV